MITSRRAIEEEFLYWMLLAVAATVMLLAMTTVLAADLAKQPRLLPSDMDMIAKPMTPESSPPFFPEDPPSRLLPPAEAAQRLWALLDSHRNGRAREALSEWVHVRLPDETAHWREIAMSSAYLHLGDLERAARHLQTSQQMQPDNAIVAYCMGLLQLEQAEAARRLPDGKKGRHLLVAYKPQEDAETYKRMAIKELYLAIARANELRLDDRLLADDPEFAEAIVIPRVSDLLAALGMENFVGAAHHTLFGLHLEQGDLREAEFHLDQAAATGLAVLYGYQDLSNAYLARDCGADAVRVQLKDLEIKYPWVRPLWQRLTGMISRAPDR